MVLEGVVAGVIGWGFIPEILCKYISNIPSVVCGSFTWCPLITTLNRLIETAVPVVNRVEPTFVFVPIVNVLDGSFFRQKYFLICSNIANAGVNENSIKPLYRGVIAKPLPWAIILKTPRYFAVIEPS